MTRTHHYLGISTDSTHPGPIRNGNVNEVQEYVPDLSSQFDLDPPPSVQLPQHNELRMRDEVNQQMRRMSVGVAQDPSCDAVVETTVSIRGLWSPQHGEISRLRAQVVALRQQVQALQQSHWDENVYDEPPPMYSSGPPSST